MDAVDKGVPFMGDAIVVARASAVNRTTLAHSTFMYPMPDTSGYCMQRDVYIPLEDTTVEQKVEVGQASSLSWRNTGCWR